MMPPENWIHFMSWPGHDDTPYVRWNLRWLRWVWKTLSLASKDKYRVRPHGERSKVEEIDRKEKSVEL